MEQKKAIPHISSRLRHHILEVPNEARGVSGIVINGKRIKTLVFTTDIAIIRNCSADAVLAVYPFTPQPTISDAILRYSSLPVFCGVGGGTTQGIRTTQLAWDAEAQGAMGVVVNAPMGNLDIERICNYIDIPLVVTVLNEHTDIAARLAAGASILNISAAARTPEVVRKIRDKFPDVPIIATLPEIQDYCRREVATLWPEVLRFDYPHNYYVDLSDELLEIKTRLLNARR